jgi:hypothetical protein
VFRIQRCGCPLGQRVLHDYSPHFGLIGLRLERWIVGRCRHRTLELDSTPHDFAIESIDLHTDTIKPGDAVIATFVARQGAAEFVCTLHPDMKGRIDLM